MSDKLALADSSNDTTY
uniref:Uncharacterized protein n=1 Tax=Arundo donax TaxID=35708 RepID=A0A0A8ZAE8_ARUDO